MKVALKETQLRLRNSTTRLAFRYGAACMTACPQAILRAVVEVDGKAVSGYSGDCLPPGWFDKSPGKDYSTQIDDMLAVGRLAEKVFAEELATPTPLFPAWLVAHQRVQSRASEWQLPALVASFGASLCERAIIDGLGRALGLPFHQLVRENLLSIDAGEAYPELAGNSPADWLPAAPAPVISVRHTVGLGDPLTASDISDGERLGDGFPHALEEYVAQLGIRYLKIKVSNRLDWDLERLGRIAQIMEGLCGQQYWVTLDGNEQYKSAADFRELVEALHSTPELATLLARTLLIEQPLERSIALSDEHAHGIRDAGQQIPVIIDESDGRLGDYGQAVQLGYRGVSSKACKGVFKSLLNAGLTWALNDRGKRNDYQMTGEDLCTVGIVPVQSDLCLVATLGLTHLERNGHHYHPGLSYLPTAQQEAALRAHADLYARQHDRVAPIVRNGQFQIGSLQCPGLGFAVEPELEDYQPAESWSFDSLGLDL